MQTGTSWRSNDNTANIFFKRERRFIKKIINKQLNSMRHLKENHKI